MFSLFFLLHFILQHLPVIHTFSFQQGSQQMITEQKQLSKKASQIKPWLLKPKRKT
jgi:hypothetical protein